MNLERGTVALLPDAPLSGKVVIDAFDLGLLEPYLPENLELDGPFDLNATISGTRAAPRAKGRVELGGGRLALRAYGFELDSLRIAADFDQNRITVHEASGKTEKGHLRLQGGVPVHEGGGDSLAGALEITGLTLRTPQGAVAEGGARMQVSGALGARSSAGGSCSPRRRFRFRSATARWCAFPPTIPGFGARKWARRRKRRRHRGGSRLISTSRWTRPATSGSRTRTSTSRSAAI